MLVAPADDDETAREMVPVRLAQELGICPKKLRAFLRHKFSRDPNNHGTRWVLTAEHVAAARMKFGRVPRIAIAPLPAKSGREALAVSSSRKAASGTALSLPCYVRPRLDVLFVALNPPTQSASNGHWFSGDQSGFFKLLYMSGLITADLPKMTADEVVFGSTKFNYKGASYGVTDLRPDLIEVNSRKVVLRDTHVEDFIRVVRECEPRIVCIIHSKIWKRFNTLLGRSTDVIDVAAVGRFTEPLSGCRSRFICNYFPNGNNISDDEKLAIFKLLRDAI